MRATSTDWCNAKKIDGEAQIILTSLLQDLFIRIQIGNRYQDNRLRLTGVILGQR